MSKHHLAELASPKLFAAALALATAAGCGRAADGPGAGELAAAAQPLSTCAQWGLLGTEGSSDYLVQNNVWNDVDGSQCLDASGAAFTVTSSSHSRPTNGPPAAYPSVYRGCHWGICSGAGSGMPMRVSDVGSVPSAWSVTAAAGTYNIAYDLWLDPSPTTLTQPVGAEIMVWIGYQGGIQPFGSPTGSFASVGGDTYQVWSGYATSWTVISYVRVGNTTSVSYDLKGFIDDARARGLVSQAWYLIDIEAGFEIWSGGAGLATNSFSVSVLPLVPPGTGGASGTGGMPAGTGGAPGTGGDVGTGGAPGTGGDPGTGGGPGSGGDSGSGGALAGTGGADLGTGGVVGSGGAPGSGGTAPASGGAPGSGGGVVGSGGAPGSGGGVVGSGGAPGSGGASATEGTGGGTVGSGGAPGTGGGVVVVAAGSGGAPAGTGGDVVVAATGGAPGTGSGGTPPASGASGGAIGSGTGGVAVSVAGTGGVTAPDGGPPAGSGGAAVTSPAGPDAGTSAAGARSGYDGCGCSASGATPASSAFAIGLGLTLPFIFVRLRRRSRLHLTRRRLG